MDVSLELPRWLHKMGYEEKIPENLKPICNVSTKFVWEQLISNVKPKQEIEHKRNNILINRLLQNDETCKSASFNVFSNEPDYPVKEIEAWKRKRKLEQQINATRERIRAAESKVNSSSASNKMKYVQLENVRRKIEVNRQQTFFLNAKAEELQGEVDNVQEMLTLACNLTPNEDEDKTEVLNTLQKCSEKLQKIVNEQKNEKPPQTPYDKSFASTKLTTSLFSSTKIGYASGKKKPRPGAADDSLGLLDDSNVTFDGRNVLAASSFRDATGNVLAQYDLPVLNNDGLNGLIESLMRRHNRLSVWNALHELNQRSKADLIKMIIGDESRNCSPVKVNKNETRLYAVHVEYELKKRRSELSVQRLERDLAELQNATVVSLSKGTANAQLIDYVRLQQQERGLTAALDHSQEVISRTLTSVRRENELKRVAEGIRAAEEGALHKISSIGHKLEAFRQIHEVISQMRTESLMLVRKLELFTHDPDWTLPLSSDISSAKTCSLVRFPLDYNRTIGSERIPVRDLPLNRPPYQEQLSSNSVYVLARILGNPAGSPAALLLDIVRRIERIGRLNGLKYKWEERPVRGWDAAEVDCRTWDTRLEHLLDKLRSMIAGPNGKKGARVLSQVHEATQLWLEMPVRKYVSEKRLVNGAPYEYYEQIFDSYYKQLP